MTATTEQRRIRVWFGEHVLCEYEAAPERTERYATLTRQRFAGLKVTVDDRPIEDAFQLPEEERLWQLTVK